MVGLRGNRVLCEGWQCVIMNLIFILDIRLLTALSLNPFSSLSRQHLEKVIKKGVSDLKIDTNMSELNH